MFTVHESFKAGWEFGNMIPDAVGWENQEIEPHTQGHDFDAFVQGVVDGAMGDRFRLDFHMQSMLGCLPLKRGDE